MNKEAIDYTSEEFWAAAPSDATHWEPESGDWLSGWIKLTRNENFYWETNDRWQEEFREDGYDYEALSKTFIPRPTTFTKPVQESSVSDNEWFVDGKCVALPPIGTEVEVDFQLFGCRVGKVVGYDGLATIVRDEGSYIGVQQSQLRPIKKELTIQEKILDKWKTQALEFAHDTKDSGHPIGLVIDFIVNNYDVKEK